MIERNKIESLKTNISNKSYFPDSDMNNIWGCLEYFALNESCESADIEEYGRGYLSVIMIFSDISFLGFELEAFKKWIRIPHEMLITKQDDLNMRIKFVFGI